VDTTWKAMIWRQFGAAIEMLENALLACPDELWSDRSRRPEFWYVAYHTLFYLDVYSSGSVKAYTPPAPFTLSELEDDVMPPRVYGKDELLAFLVHGRQRCRAAIETMTDDKASRRCGSNGSTSARPSCSCTTCATCSTTSASSTSSCARRPTPAPAGCGRRAEGIVREDRRTTRNTEDVILRPITPSLPSAGDRAGRRIHNRGSR